MKQIAFLALMLLTFAGCSSITEDLGQLENKEVAEGNKEYVVSIGMAGEIVDISSVPLTKASGDDLYGFQVYVKKKDDESAIYDYYAYGLFDDISDLKITLIEGYLYKIVATCIVNGKNKINSIFDSSTGIQIYECPFYRNIQNKFVYSASGCMDYLDSPMSDFLNVTYIQPDRYYGEVINIDPSQTEDIKIEMLKCMTGMKLVVSELTEGTLTINVNNQTYTFTAGDATSEIETIFVLRENSYYTYLSNVWNYEKISPKETYSYSSNLKVTHTHSYNIGEVTYTINDVIYNDYVTFTRNKQTLIKINLTASDSDDTDTPSGESSTNKITITLEDAGELQPGDEVIIGEEESEDTPEE